MASKFLVLLVVAYFTSSAFGISGGRFAAAKELPFVVDIGACSGSIIGPDVLLTAARCGKRSVQFVHGGISYSGDCDNHPNWSPQRSDFDLALCKFSPEISQVDLLARIERGVQVVANGRIIFAGFGAGLKFANLVIRDIFSNAFTGDGDGVIQAGDVGGPAIVDVADLVLGPFRILGVANALYSGFQKTFFAGIDNAERFFQDFIRLRGAKICGLNDECKVNSGEECQSERDIVDFFEVELANAKLLLRQCLEKN